MAMSRPEKAPMKMLPLPGARLAGRVLLGLMAAGVVSLPAHASDALAPSAEAARRAAPSHFGTAAAPVTTSAGKLKRARSSASTPSDEARQLAEWILASGNNRRLPFLIVDKKKAMVYAFHADGLLRGMAPVLLGSAVGDDSVPGIGRRKLSAIGPAERTTPAGRFVAALDRNLQGVEILWVDYEAAISLHRVVTGVPKERRAQRLTSPTPLDNRISFGCINVPGKFFDQVIRRAFKGTNGIVYVLPETRPAHEVFDFRHRGYRPLPSDSRHTAGATVSLLRAR